MHKDQNLKLKIHAFLKLKEEQLRGMKPGPKTQD